MSFINFRVQVKLKTGGILYSADQLVADEVSNGTLSENDAISFMAELELEIERATKSNANPKDGLRKPFRMKQSGGTKVFIPTTSIEYVQIVPIDTSLN